MFEELLQKYLSTLWSAEASAVDRELRLSGPRLIAHRHKREGDDQRYQKPHGVDAVLITTVLRRLFRAAAATTSHASHASHAAHGNDSC